MTMNETATPKNRRAGNGLPLLPSVLITVIALGAIVVHLARPDLSIDAVTLGLLVLAALPWLAPLVKSLELPGGWKVEFQEVKRTAEEAKSAADSAQRKVEFVEDLALAGQTQQAPPPTPKAAESAPAPAPGLLEGQTRQRAAIPDTGGDFTELIDRYNTIRDTQPSSSARTAAMTAVVRDMVALSTQMDAFDARPALAGQDGGTRLSGYAYLYARPDARLLDDLIACVAEREDQPFGQYWGIRAIDKNLRAGEVGTLAHGVVRRLRQFLNRLPEGSDRHYELSRLLREMES
jgi:hypothetical protein